MQQEKISIIIPCFNDSDYIEQSVQSALDQTHQNKEIIVVDDGSNEKTKAILKKLEPKINFLITQENKGTSAARNTGITAASGEYILVLDSDDYFELDFCEKAIEIFKKNFSVSIVTCFSRWFSNNRAQIIFKPKGGSIKDALVNNVAMGSSMFKKEEWIAVSGYDEIMLKGYEDWEFYIRILALGGEAVVIPEVLFNYRNKQNSRNKKANEHKYELLEYIYLKHSNIYKEKFSFFIRDWLDSVQKGEAFKQQVMESMDFKIGNKILKPFRFFGFFKRNKY